MTNSGGMEEVPAFSLVVLSWNNLELTERCVESLRQHTDVDYELIIVDNGSTDGSADYAESAADIPVLNETNLGFAAGMNAGLAEATGRYVAFINNDTVFPPGWASQIVDTLQSHPDAGIVLPAVTAAGNPMTVRDEPGNERIVLNPFAEFPSGVVYVMWADLIRALGGWNDAYETASAEDLDLSFTVWAHGLDVVLDERVLIEHVSQASVRNLPDRKDLYRRNLAQFLDRWETLPLGSRPMLDSIDPDRYRANQERAQTAVVWIRRMLAAREEAREAKARLEAQRRTRERRWRPFRSRS